MKSNKSFILGLILSFVGGHSIWAGTTVTALRTLGLVEPLGIESTPSFSWKITSDQRGYKQTAYSITVTDDAGNIVWNSGKVASSRQTDIPYEGTAIASRTKYIWSVTVYDQNDDASETATSTFETGILTQAEWKDAKWIQPKTSACNAMVEIYPDGGNVNARYIKMNVTASGPHASTDANYGFVQIAEIEVYNKDGENIARNATFSATNEWKNMTGYGWSINYINDGIIANGSTHGFTTTQNTTTTVISIDLKSAQDVARIVLYPRQDSPAVGDATKAANFPKSYTISTSTDNVSFTQLYSVTNAAAPSYEANTNVPYLGRNFVISKEVKSARLYASALGVFTMHLNGKYVTDNVLEPGESAYDKHILYSTYDVTSFLQQGSNTLIGQVAGGLPNMTTMSDRFVKAELTNNTATTSLRGLLFITYIDDSTDCIATDENWGSRKSPLNGSNWYGGEDYDARNTINGLFDGAFDVSGWEKCQIVDQPTFCAPSAQSTTLNVGDMRAKEYEPLRVVETWKAVSVTKNSAGNYLVDFGQNFAGTYRFTLKGTAGTKITLYDSELAENGACKFEYMYQAGGTTNQTLDTYTFKGDTDGETWGPEFMYHGFRYLEISGLSEAPSADDFVAMRIRSNMDSVGEFATSSTLLNDIHKICYNGIQSQLYNTVTDCPHREKLGWLDVPNMMYQSLSYNFDVKSLLSKVVMDAFDSQGSNGYVPSTVPHFMRAYDDDLNWGGAAITIPWRNYKQYGDKVLMNKYYVKMKKLLNYYTTLTNGNIINDNYSVLSDWGQNTCGLSNYTSSSFTLTCTYYYLLGAMSEMATELGKEGDATTWTNLAAQVKTAFNKKFYKNGVYEYGNQANYGMALYYGLVDEENIPTVAKALAEAVISTDYSIKTGEIGLRPTLMALADNGYNNVVYKMAQKTTYPSYGYWVKQGATTSLEYWDMSLSQNHCMMNHIEEWFYGRLGGIVSTSEGYETCSIKPWIPADMATASVSVNSARGIVGMAWKRSDTSTTYTISVPAGCTASVSLPIVNGYKLYENDSEISSIASVSNVVYADTLANFTLGSGTYIFTMNASTLPTEKESAQEVEYTNDVTDSYIANAGFESKNTSVVPWAPTSWTLQFPDTDGSYGNISTSEARTVNPTEGTYDWHIWYSTKYISVRLYQTLNLPTGSYKVYGDMRCVDNAAITGKQRLFATVGGDVINDATIYSSAYNADGSININNSDNENKGNWQTLNLDFTLSEASTVTIGFDCPQGDNTSSLGGFQVDNVRLFKNSDVLSVPTFGYATYYASEYAYLMPEGLEGYIVRTTENTDDSYSLLNQRKYLSGSIVPASEPLLIHRSAGKTLEATSHDIWAVKCSESKVNDNMLSGTFTEQDGKYLTTGGDSFDYYYELTTKNGENPGFYWGASDGGQFLMTNPHQAYLIVPQSMNLPLFVLEGNDTGISSVEKNETSSNDKIYDLTGRCLNKIPSHGFYIINKKKIFQK